MMTRPLPSEQLNIQPGENPVQAIHKLDLKGLQHELIKRQKTANIKGSKSVLRQRLRKTFEQQLFANTKAAQQAPPEEYLYLLVLDLETRTLEEQNTQIEDVIEFAVALFSVETLSIEDTFHSYVKPVHDHPLSPQCTKLTGISQDMLEAAPSWGEVLKLFEDWLQNQLLSVSPSLPPELGDAQSLARWIFVTHGKYDMDAVVRRECKQINLDRPSYMRAWIDLDDSFSKYYKLPHSPVLSMLQSLGLSFEGHIHHGADDVTNLARIAEVLIRDGWRPNARACNWIESSDEEIVCDYIHRPDGVQL